MLPWPDFRLPNSIKEMVTMELRDALVNNWFEIFTAIFVIFMFCNFFYYILLAFCKIGIKIIKLIIFVIYTFVLRFILFAYGTSTTIYFLGSVIFQKSTKILWAIPKILVSPENDPKILKRLNIEYDKDEESDESIPWIEPGKLKLDLYHSTADLKSSNYFLKRSILRASRNIILESTDQLKK